MTVNSSFRIILKTVTNLEFESLEKLKNEIFKYFFSDLVFSFEEVPDINIHGEIYEQERVRICHESRAGKTKINNTELLLFIKPGTEVEIVIPDCCIDENICKKIYNFLYGIIKRKIRIGDNITLGRGICNLNEISVNPKHQNNTMYSNILKLMNIDSCVCRGVLIKAHSKDGILIRNNKYTGSEDKPYVVNDKDNPIIPASTWKGIFRHRIREWIEYLGNDMEILDLLFGNRDKGTKGKLIFYDSEIIDSDIKEVRRLHLDKFSGAAFSNGLFSNQYVCGAFELKIECMDDYIDYKPYITAVLYDLKNKRVNVGADIGIGKGFIDIDDVKFID